MGDAGFFGAMVGMGETFIPAFALALGMGETFAGILASVPVAIGGVMQLVSLRLMNWIGSYQRWVVLCACVQSLSFLPLVIFTIWGKVTPTVLLLAASVYWASGLASGPAWNTWMESLVPSSVRALYFAKRARLQQLMTFLGLIGGGLLLQTASAGQWPTIGFLILFALAAVSRGASMVCLATHRHDSRWEAETSVHTSQEKATSGAGSKLLVYLIAVQVCVQISGPFFAPFMLKELGMSYMEFVLLLAVAFLFRIATLTLWSRFATKFGAPTLMWVGAISLIPLSALWIVSQNLLWLAIVQAASGMAWGAYELGFFLLFFETIPRSRRPSMLTYYNLGNSLALLFGASVGAVILYCQEYGPTAYFTLFAISSIGRLLAIGLLFRVRLRPITVRHLAIRVLGIRPATAALDVPILPSLEDSKGHTDRGD